VTVQGDFYAPLFASVTRQNMYLSNLCKFNYQLTYLGEKAKARKDTLSRSPKKTFSIPTSTMYSLFAIPFLYTRSKNRLYYSFLPPGGRAVSYFCPKPTPSRMEEF
jgi:hypothetical protein